jgi:hypothetical protein
MVLPVDQGDVDRRTGQRLRGLDAAEAGSDNDDIGRVPDMALICSSPGRCQDAGMLKRASFQPIKISTTPPTVSAVPATSRNVILMLPRKMTLIPTVNSGYVADSGATTETGPAPSAR